GRRSFVVGSSLPRGPGTRDQEPRTKNQGPKLERETGIEPATNSLEGCDSTTELLPPSSRPGRCSPNFHALTRGNPIDPRSGRASRSLATFAGCGSTSIRLRHGARCSPARVQWWRGKDSNLRSHKGDRFTVCCV